MQDLNGQVVWITGAGTGIGESGALKLADAGCQIVLSGRRSEPLELVAQQIANRGHAKPLIQPLDVSNKTDVQNTVNNILQKLGKIDIAVLVRVLMYAIEIGLQSKLMDGIKL